ncbi:hypothetical protein K8R20_01190 [bacterium]|nr:hypothetical protein [bacterium]
MESKNLLLDNSGQQLLNETKVNSYFEILLTFLNNFLKWWYIQMPIWHLRTLKRLAIVLDDNLSLSLLIRNFFLPWHRDKNLLGYVVGITSKALYLPIAITLLLTITLTYTLFLFFWLLLPPTALLFTLRSFFV